MAAREHWCALLLWNLWSKRPCFWEWLKLSLCCACRSEQRIFLHSPSYCTQVSRYEAIIGIKVLCLKLPGSRQCNRYFQAYHCRLTWWPHSFDGSHRKWYVLVLVWHTHRRHLILKILRPRGQGHEIGSRWETLSHDRKINHYWDKDHQIWLLFRHKGYFSRICSNQWGSVPHSSSRHWVQACHFFRRVSTIARVWLLDRWVRNGRWSRISRFKPLAYHGSEAEPLQITVFYKSVDIVGC